LISSTRQSCGVAVRVGDCGGASQLHEDIASVYKFLIP
jgi:hypothetical protein